jgi:Cyclic nucleotide-binding domain
MRPTPEQLAEVPLFESLSAAELKAIAAPSELRQEDAGAILVGEGSLGYSLFVIQSGSANVTSRGKILTALGPGDFFGEIALLGEGVRTATVTASSAASLIVMLGSDFRVFERSFPGASAAMKTRDRRPTGTTASPPAAPLVRRARPDGRGGGAGCRTRIGRSTPLTPRSCRRRVRTRAQEAAKRWL